jgi:hypothetical protein
MSDEKRPPVAAPTREQQQAAVAASVADPAKRADMGRALAPPDPTTLPDLDETIPGGKYKVGDKFVNANGQEITEDGKVVADLPQSDKDRR